MAVRKLAQSWQYDFKLPGFARQRQGGYATKAEALLAEKSAREALLSGTRKLSFREGYTQYMEATRMKDRGRDAYEHLWKRIEPELGHLFIEEVDTSALDGLKSKLPRHLGPKSINQHLILIRAVLRFLWKRGKLKSVPYIPMESVPKPHVDWYTEKERDQLLEGMFRLEPQWYLFYYLTMRLGLRAGEVCGVRSDASLLSSSSIRPCSAERRSAKPSSSHAKTTRRTCSISRRTFWRRSSGIRELATPVESFSSRRPASSRVTSTAT